MSALPAIRELPRARRMSVPFSRIPVDVLTSTDLSPWARLLYPLLLHYHSEEQGCFPGQDRLAADLGISERSVRRSLDELVAAKLVVKKQRGRGNTNTYLLNLDGRTPVADQEAYDRTPVAVPDRTPVAYKQEPVEQEERIANAIPKKLEGFDEFWAAYPKKKSKGDAERRWEKINPNHDLRRKMLLAIEVNRKSEDWTEKNGKYIPHPATWLNGRCWEDEVTPNSSTPSPVNKAWQPRDDQDELAKLLANEPPPDEGSAVQHAVWEFEVERLRQSLGVGS